MSDSVCKIKTDTQPCSIIEANHIWKTYRMGKKSLDVLKDVSLSVNRGEFVSISGHSGAGKSTLLHILGLLDEPSKGIFLFDGNDTNCLNGKKKSLLRNQSIGFIFQFFYLLPELSAFDNVLLPALIRKGAESPKDTRNRAKGLLCRVGLEQRLDHKPQELSGGEQQRVAIARSLINHPDIILADEPTGNLDIETGKEIQALLVSLHKEESLTVIVVTHNEQLASMCPRHLKMVDGYIYEIKKEN